MRLLVELTPKQALQFTAIAARLNIAPEVFAVAALRDLLDRREDEFETAVTRCSRRITSCIAVSRSATPGSMRYVSLAEVLILHERVLNQTGGAAGLRDLGALQSAIAHRTLASLAFIDSLASELGR